MIDQLRNPIEAISLLDENEHCLYFANNSYIVCPGGIVLYSSTIVLFPTVKTR